MVINRLTFLKHYLCVKIEYKWINGNKWNKLSIDIMEELIGCLKVFNPHMNILVYTVDGTAVLENLIMTLAF